MRVQLVEAGAQNFHRHLDGQHARRRFFASRGGFEHLPLFG